MKKTKDMTFKELREYQRSLETANVGPGKYVGNKVDFGNSVRGGVICPPQREKSKPPVTPGPGMYNPD